MLKFVVLAVLFVAVAAKPSEDVKKRDAIFTDAGIIPLGSALKTTAFIQEPTLAKIGDYVQSVPTAVSHQSSTIVHDRANVVTPIVAPALKTRLAPVLSDYNVPLLRSYPAAYQYSSYPYYSYYY